ncbi:MAG: glycosyl transferase [Lachnospiraceae bacterium]|nr:glycosyl transferase [Lachnospiraceae bacterium]
MIPRIVHYCWFGRNPKPKNIEKYIRGWKEILFDYEFKEWNEENFDIENSIPYVKQAYAAEKYAFVSDYVRIYALYEYGGIYLDTDVEIMQRFENYLEGKSLVTGFESDRSLLTAFIAADKNNSIIKEFFDSYQQRDFILKDGKLDLTPINVGFSALMAQKGIDLDINEYQELPGGIAVYPIEIFCGFDVSNWHECMTKNTVMVHHMNASWVDGKGKLYFNTITFLQSILGYRTYDLLKKHYTNIKKRLIKRN